MENPYFSVSTALTHVPSRGGRSACQRPLQLNNGGSWALIFDLYLLVQSFLFSSSYPTYLRVF